MELDFDGLKTCLIIWEGFHNNELNIKLNLILSKIIIFSCFKKLYVQYQINEIRCFCFLEQRICNLLRLNKQDRSKINTIWFQIAAGAKSRIFLDACSTSTDKNTFSASFALLSEPTDHLNTSG